MPSTPSAWQTLRQLGPTLWLLATSNALVSCVSFSPGPGGREVRNLTYAEPGGRKLRLDLYLPTTPATPQGSPVIVFIHPGGWRSGGRSQVKLVPGLVGSTGCAVASIQHRLSDAAPWPAQIEDARAAVRWLRVHAADYGLDPRRVGVIGFSSGGQMAALLGTRGGSPDNGGNLPGPAESVQAVCDVSGPTDFSRTPDSLLGKLALLGLFHGKPEDKPDLARTADPVNYVQGGEPPFLIIHGDADPFVPPGDSERLAAALRAKGSPVRHIVVRGAGHIPHGPPQQEAIAAFFREHLREGRR